jgi:hypothetical protein
MAIDFEGVELVSLEDVPAELETPLPLGVDGVEGKMASCQHARGQPRTQMMRTDRSL